MKKVLLSFLFMFSCVSFAATEKIVLAGTTWCPACNVAKPELINFSKLNKNVEIEIIDLDTLTPQQLRNVFAKYDVDKYIPEYFFLINDEKKLRVIGALDSKKVSCLLEKLRSKNLKGVNGKLCGITNEFIKIY